MPSASYPAAANSSTRPPSLPQPTSSTRPGGGGNWCSTNVPKSLIAVSVAEIRRRVVEAQGYASRPRTGTAAEVRATIRRVGCIQLDSVSTVERSHRLALGARIGAYPESSVSRLLRAGEVFEYW